MDYTFTGGEGDFINLSTAVTLTSEYQRSEISVVKAEFFGKNKLLEILNQEGCMGIRCYFGTGEHGEMTLVLVGADEKGKDIIIENQNCILETGMPCPDYCADDSPL